MPGYMAVFNSWMSVISNWCRRCNFQTYIMGLLLGISPHSNATCGAGKLSSTCTTPSLAPLPTHTYIIYTASSPARSMYDTFPKLYLLHTTKAHNTIVFLYKYYVCGRVYILQYKQWVVCVTMKPVVLLYSAGVLQFERALPPEVVEWVTDDSETISLPCRIGGATTGGSPLVFFLRDGEMISSSSQRDNGIYVIGTSFISFRVLMIEKRKGNEGLYQCVGQAGNDRSTSVVSSTYVNLQCEFTWNILFCFLSNIN